MPPRRSPMSSLYTPPSLENYLKADIRWPTKPVVKGPSPWRIVQGEDETSDQYFTFIAECKSSTSLPKSVTRGGGPVQYRVPYIYMHPLRDLFFPVLLQEHRIAKQEALDKTYLDKKLERSKNKRKGPIPIAQIATLNPFALKSWWLTMVVFQAFLMELEEYDCNTPPVDWRSSVLHCWLWREYTHYSEPKQHTQSGRALFKQEIARLGSVPYADDILLQCKQQPHSSCSSMQTDINVLSDNSKIREREQAEQRAAGALHRRRFQKKSCKASGRSRAIKMASKQRVTHDEDEGTDEEQLSRRRPKRGSKREPSAADSEWLSGN